MSTITREQAARIAADVLHFSAERDAYNIGRVVAFDELRGAPPAAYICSSESIEDCWIIYLERKTFFNGVCSSTIMLVSKLSGHMVYFGSAGDEG
jgi:hypothetical protein